jgi:hypothetical protein
LVAIHPQVLVSRHLDRLRRDAHLVAESKNRAFHDCIYLQLPRDLREGLARPFVLRDTADVAGSNWRLNITTLNQIAGGLFHEMSQLSGINSRFTSSVHRWQIKYWSFL